MKKLPVLVATLWAMTAAPLLSHEFWIDPKEYQVESGENVVAWLRNGQNFKGIDLAYFDRRVILFDQVEGGGRRNVDARSGDSPAFDAPVKTDGLFTLLYQSTADRLTYKTWEKFQTFVDHKAFGDVQALHDARGLPDAGFGETYTRYAKSLIAIGDGAGTDAAHGLEIEIVALKNPYTDDVSEGLPVKVIYREMPRAGTQVELFERPPEGDVVVTTVLTDAEGIALVPVKAGHAYLLDNVILREPSEALAEQKNAVWETLWAALTFAVPAAR
jgi:cobalt/nickel transport protein